MAARPRALQVLAASTAQSGGGAERIALDLHHRYLSEGCGSTLWVGHRTGPAERGVVEFPNDALRGIWARSVLRKGSGRPAARLVAEPLRTARRVSGRDDNDHPGTTAFAGAAHAADVVQLHNLHGGYFDLRRLPDIARRTPTVLTLHDEWITTGHCAHAFACDRHLLGCGHCPDLRRAPEVRRDATAANWRARRAVLSSAPVHLAAPSRWLLDRVLGSQALPQVVGSRVLPNGVDLTVFTPGDRAAARARLGLPVDGHVLLFVAAGGSANAYKDFTTVTSAVEALLRSSSGSTTFVALGGDVAGPSRPHLRAVPSTSDRTVVADYYRAADVYLHAARADTFPTTVLEAMACGTPVVATAVGGIPEQVRSASVPGSTGPEAQRPTGVLTPPGDAGALAAAVAALLGRPGLRAEMAVEAREAAETDFDISTCALRYLEWFSELAERR